MAINRQHLRIGPDVRMTAIAGNYLRKNMKLEQDVSKKPTRGRKFENNFGCVY
jgi:hypothetical protein